MNVRIGEQWRKLRLEQIEQILAAPRLVRIPRAPACVIGLLCYKGQPVPVLQQEEQGGKADTGDFAIVLHREDGTLWAFLADEIAEDRQTGDDGIDSVYE